jgi:hypothetical protein
MSSYPSEAFEGADTYIAELRAENVRLKEALDFIDDHGRALAAMEIMKAQRAIISEQAEAIKAMSEELNWDYKDLLERSSAALGKK